jgi:hypothetical protein
MNPFIPPAELYPRLRRCEIPGGIADHALPTIVNFTLASPNFLE